MPSRWRSTDQTCKRCLTMFRMEFAILTFPCREVPPGVPLSIVLSIPNIVKPRLHVCPGPICCCQRFQTKRTFLMIAFLRNCVSSASATWHWVGSQISGIFPLFLLLVECECLPPPVILLLTLVHHCADNRIHYTNIISAGVM